MQNNAKSEPEEFEVFETKFEESRAERTKMRTQKESDEEKEEEFIRLKKD